MAEKETIPTLESIVDKNVIPGLVKGIPLSQGKAWKDAMQAYVQVDANNNVTSSNRVAIHMTEVADQITKKGTVKRLPNVVIGVQDVTDNVAKHVHWSVDSESGTIRRRTKIGKGEVTLDVPKFDRELVETIRDILADKIFTPEESKKVADRMLRTPAKEELPSPSASDRAKFARLP